MMDESGRLFCAFIDAISTFERLDDHASGLPRFMVVIDGRDRIVIGDTLVSLKAKFDGARAGMLPLQIHGFSAADVADIHAKLSTVSDSPTKTQPPRPTPAPKTEEKLLDIPGSPTPAEVIAGNPNAPQIQVEGVRSRVKK
ncbi:MAG: hypothetical protein KGL39_25165 [Patescibacteria group bacterium]|nr:hypothetical protein [Patescibacteria group bacterium]